jgi:hypothetical protein
VQCLEDIANALNPFNVMQLGIGKKVLLFRLVSNGTTENVLKNTHKIGIPEFHVEMKAELSKICYKPPAAYRDPLRSHI